MTFPRDFNSKTDFEKLRDEIKLEKLRTKVYNQYLEKGDNFIDMVGEKAEHVEIVKNELESRGFKTKMLFNNTALLIYINEDNVRIWLDNHLL